MTTEPMLLRLGMDDLEWMTALLTEAFLPEAPATHRFLGPKRRLQTRNFMQGLKNWGMLRASADQRVGRCP